MVEVQQTHTGDPLRFAVTVREGSGSTRHEVSMTQTTYQKLTGGKVSPERCIQGAFAFLLERESKESILRSFDVTVISRYFSDFERKIEEYL